MFDYFKELTVKKAEEAIASSRDKALEALSYLQETIDSGKGFPDILYPYTILLFKLGKKEDSANSLRRLLSMNDHYQRYIELADRILYEKYSGDEKTPVVTNLKGNGKQLNKMRKEISIPKTGFLAAEFYSVLGDYYLINSKFQKAFEYFCVSYLSGKPADEFLYKLGLIAYRQGMTEEAGTAFREALEIEPENMRTCLELSHVEAELGNESSSFRLLTIVHNKHEEWPDVSFRIAEYYCFQNDNVNAEKYLRLALKYNPNYNSANILLFKILINSYGVKEAETFVRGISDKSLSEKFDFLLAMTKKSDYTSLMKKMLIADNIYDEVNEGLWDDVIGNTDKEYLINYIKYLYQEGVIETKEMQNGINRINFSDDNL